MPQVLDLLGFVPASVRAIRCEGAVRSMARRPHKVARFLRIWARTRSVASSLNRTETNSICGPPPPTKACTMRLSISARRCTSISPGSTVGEPPVATEKRNSYFLTHRFCGRPESFLIPRALSRNVSTVRFGGFLELLGGIMGWLKSSRFRNASTAQTPQQTVFMSVHLETSTHPLQCASEKCQIVTSCS